MNDQITLWQVVAAYVFSLVGGWISTSLHLAHKPLCALISFAAGTLLGVTLFAILPESLGDSPWWAVALAAATGYESASQWPNSSARIQIAFANSQSPTPKLQDGSQSPW